MTTTDDLAKKLGLDPSEMPNLGEWPIPDEVERLRAVLRQVSLYGRGKAETSLSAYHATVELGKKTSK